MKVNLNFRVPIVLSFLLSAALFRSLAQTGPSASPATPLNVEKGLFDSDEIFEDYAERKRQGPAAGQGSRTKVLSVGTFIYKRRQQQGGHSGPGENEGIFPQDERKLLLSTVNDRFSERRGSSFFNFQGNKQRLNWWFRAGEKNMW